MYTGKYNHTHFVFEIMNTETKKGIHFTIVGPEMAVFLRELIEAANKTQAEQGDDLKPKEVWPKPIPSSTAE
jgi:hypothetical protein